MVATALELLVRGRDTPGGRSVLGGAAGAGTSALASQRRLQQEAGPASGAGSNPNDQPVPLEACNWLNITACNTTGDQLAWALRCDCTGAPARPSTLVALRPPLPAVHLSSQGRGVLAVAYNPLGWSVEAPVRVPLNTSATCDWRVTGGWGGAGADRASWCLPTADTLHTAVPLQAPRARRWRRSWCPPRPPPAACSS